LEYERAKDYLDYLGIPPEGAAEQLKNDPEIQGKRIFVRQCASCHAWTNAEGHGVTAQDISAPNLHGFATTEWFERILDPKRIVSADMFGKTKHVGGDMVGYVTGDYAAVPDETKKLIVRAMVAEAGLIANKAADEKDAADIKKGQAAVRENCGTCHKVRGAEDPGAGAPDLTAYGSEAWLKRFIANPAHPSMYGEKNDRMPAFAPAEKEQDAAKNLLTANDIELLALWLRGDLKDLELAYGKKAPSAEAPPTSAPANKESPTTK
jgi:mono/diheme cytochrome c family protein